MTRIGWRRAALILACYGAAAVAWLAFSSGVGASLVAEGYDAGDATRLGRIVRIFADGLARDATLVKWETARPIVVLTLAIHAVFVLTALRWVRKAEQAASVPEGWVGKVTPVFVIVASLGFMLLAAIQGSIQDYTLFRDIWREILRGHDPWFMVPGGPRGMYPLNAYGPLFNVLTLPTYWHEWAPKIIFAAAYWFFVAHLVLVVGRQTLPPWVRLATAVWFCSPYPVVELAFMGHFDVLVALLAIAAIEARARDRWPASAGWLASGILLKYYPGVLAPFLALDRGRVRVRYLATVGGLCLGGLGITWLIWGGSFARPFWLALERQSMYLSIFRFLNGPYSPIGRDTLVFSPDEYATPLMLFVLYKAWQWSKRNETGPRASCSLAAAIMLALYKVGFPQYYMLLFLSLPNWFVREFPNLRRRSTLATAYMAAFAWVGWFDMVITQREPADLTDWVGLPMFTLMVLLIAAVIAAAPREAV